RHPRASMILEREPGLELDPAVARRGGPSGAEPEPSRAGQRSPEERRAQVAHGRGRVGVVQEVLGGDGEGQAAAALAAAAPSFTAATAPPTTEPAAPSRTPATAPAVAGRRGSLAALASDGERLAEAQVDDHEPGSDAEVPRDDRLAGAGARVQEAIRRHDRPRLVGSARE